MKSSQNPDPNPMSDGDVHACARGKGCHPDANRPGRRLGNVFQRGRQAEAGVLLLAEPVIGQDPDQFPGDASLSGRVRKNRYMNRLVEEPGFSRSPEHQSFVKQCLKDEREKFQESEKRVEKQIAEYQKAAARKSDFERTEMAKDKTGVEIKVPLFINEGDKILFCDDFLACGNAIKGVQKILTTAGAELVGCAIAIEKGFQHGGDTLRSEGIRVESLAIVESMTDDAIVFRK